VAARLAARVALDRPARVVVVVFTDAAGRMPRRELVETVCDGMPVPVDDALLMRAGRWWSYSCADDDCCPAEGRAVDTGSSAALAVAAAQAINGRAVLADRAAVAASVAPVAGDAAA